MQDHKSSNFPSNLAIGMIFLFLNPMVALTIAAILNLYSNKIKPLWGGFVFSLSFSLFFLMREYVGHGSDDGGVYVRMYKNIDGKTFSSLYENFSNSFIHNEFLWYQYTLLFNNVFGYQPTLFVFVTYFSIFSLSAYLAYLVNNKYLLGALFFLVFIKMTYLNSAFHTWRHIIASLLFLIGIVKFNSNNSNYIARLFLYSSFCFHIVTLGFIILFEGYSALIKTKHSRYSFSNNKNIIKLCFVIPIFIVLYLNQESLFSLISNIPPLQKSFIEFGNEFSSFRIRSFYEPLNALILFYVFLNYKRLYHYEVFTIATYFTIVFISRYITIIPSVFYGRALTIFWLMTSLLFSRTLLLVNIKYSAVAIIVVSIYRFYLLTNEAKLGLLIYAGNNDFYNPFNGIFMLLINYNKLTFI